MYCHCDKRKNWFAAPIGTVIVFWLPAGTMAGCGPTQVQAVGESVDVDCNVKYPKEASQEMIALVPDCAIDISGAAEQGAKAGASNIRRARTFDVVTGLFKLPHIAAIVLPRHATRGRPLSPLPAMALVALSRSLR